MSGSSSAPPAPSLVDVLLDVVDAENAAVYGYAVAGARLGSAAERTLARGDYDVHRAQLQAVTGWLAKSSSTPAPPVAVYSMPASVGDPAAASALLGQLEEATAARYADLVAAATGSLQRAAALALQSAAVRELHWRGRSTPFPGLLNRLPPG